MMMDNTTTTVVAVLLFDVVGDFVTSVGICEEVGVNEYIIVCIGGTIPIPLYDEEDDSGTLSLLLAEVDVVVLDGSEVDDRGVDSIVLECAVEVASIALEGRADSVGDVLERVVVVALIDITGEDVRTLTLDETDVLGTG